MYTSSTVTVINNEPTFRWTLSRLLERHGFAVATHERNNAAVDTVRQSGSRAVIVEASSGSAVSATLIVERLRRDESTRNLPIIVCSPDGKFLHSYGEYLRGRGCVVVGRPYNEEQILEILRSVVTSQNLLAPSFVDDEIIAFSS